MKFRILVLLALMSMILVLFTGCAQPNNPVTPEAETVYLELQAVYSSEGYVRDIAITDDYVYVAEDEAGFSIWDTNSNELLSRMRSYDVVSGIDTTTIEFTNIQLIVVDEASNGMLAYNRHGSDTGIYIFRIADKRNPVYKFKHGGNSADISVLKATSIDSTQFQFYWLNQDDEYYTGKIVSTPGGEYWMVSGEGTGYFDYNVADFDENYDTGTIYCASYQLGLKIVEKQVIENSIDFPLTGTVSTTGQTLAVKVVDNIAYLGNREEGIQVLDISDFNNPVELFNYDTTGLASDIEVNTDLNVFALASSSGGVYLFSGPEGEIKRLQRIDDSEIGYVNMIEMRGDLLYVGTRYGVYKYKIVNL